jgi:hypothetical protein
VFYVLLGGSCMMRLRRNFAPYFASSPPMRARSGGKELEMRIMILSRGNIASSSVCY